VWKRLKGKTDEHDSQKPQGDRWEAEALEWRSAGSSVGLTAGDQCAARPELRVGSRLFDDISFCQECPFSFYPVTCIACISPRASRFAYRVSDRVETSFIPNSAIFFEL
jgi:hypothetical protein